MRLRYLIAVAALLLAAAYLNLAFGFQPWVYLVALQIGCVPVLLGLIETERNPE